MLRKMPPLEAVEAFLSATRARSFRAAASSLALSPSAFSRRIQVLERFTGLQLFDRSGASTVLTEEGTRYLAQVGPAIEAILCASRPRRQTHGDYPIRIATSHSMAAEWLMPRLPGLLAETGIALEITISRDPQLLRSNLVDVALWGGPTRPSTLVDVIAELDAVPVSARRLADGRAPPATLAALVHHPLIEVVSNTGLWRHWLSRAGYRGPDPAINARYETNQLKDEAAASGQGVTLVVPLVSQRFLAADRLVACTRLRVPTDQSYCLHYADAPVRVRPQVQDFLVWLKAEAAESLRQFDRWYEAAAPRNPNQAIIDGCVRGSGAR